MNTYFERDYWQRRRRNVRPKKLSTWNRESVRGHLRAMYGDNCHWCGELMRFNASPNHDRFPTIEHLVPRSEGGSNQMENLRLACKRCNNGRHAQPSLKKVLNGALSGEAEKALSRAVNNTHRLNYP